MRGISPVITTVLLLLMAVAAVGGAWVWYQRMQTSAMAGGSGQVENIKKSAVPIGVDSASCDGSDWKVTLSNPGSSSSQLDNVTLMTSSGGDPVAYYDSWTVGANSLSEQTLNTISGTCSSGTVYYVTGRIGANYVFRNYAVIT